ncbi:MAG TPA: adenylate/guanylate cyclase domain-containing protein [Acidimicrobiia bacterium]
MSGGVVVTELPTGTVTFLFTDLERSTRIWEDHPDAMRDALARHDRILRDAVEQHGGYVVKTTGDGVHGAFATAHDALESTFDAQRALADERWPEATGPLRVRMGVHTGEAELRDGDYYGQALNRAARLMSVGHGGQVLVSESVETITRGALPDGLALIELGEHRLRDLSDPVRVFQLVHPDLQRDFPPLRALDVLPGNLPRQLTTFVGRADEVDRVAAAVRDRPLVTLTGVGGVGKTRLALQVAAEVAPEFPGGAWLCELAPVTDASALSDAVAATLGAPRPVGRSPDESLLEHLEPKRLLLVLDNCEHVLDAAARLVDAVTHRCPQVAVLATSREGLALAGEQIIAVPSLGVPAAEDEDADLERADAVRLFVDRARDAKQDFVLDALNGPSVAQLCRRLDGIPLAIELAAARVSALSPQALVDRLDQRFKLLTRGSRAALERHQTLRSTIDWSYELLDASERRALNALSVLAGSCDLAAAEAVLADEQLETGDVADTVGQLVDKSLVVVDDDDADPRYRLLETIRQYAQDQLEATGDTPAVRARHAACYVARAEAAGPRLRSREQVDAAAATARDTDNFRAALDFALESRSVDLALRLVAPLGVYGTAIGYAAMEWAAAAITVPDADRHPLFPKVAAWAAWGVTMRGDVEQGERLSATARACAERLGTNEPSLCQVPATLGFFRGDLATAERWSDEWVELVRPDADPYELAHALIMQAVAWQRSDPAKTRRTIEEAVQIARDAGIMSALSIGLSSLGSLVAQEEPDRALEVLAEAEQVGILVGDDQAVANAIQMRGWIAGGRADWHGALEAAAHGAAFRLQRGDVSLLITNYALGALALANLGHVEPAATLRGASERLVADRVDQELWVRQWYFELMPEADRELARGLGDDRLGELRRLGEAMPHVDAVALLCGEADRVLSED